jgi:hypothetical protein
MPVYKYRSIADMPAPPPAPEASLAERIRQLWKRSFLLAPPLVVPGVTRFHDIESANEARNQATLERMRRTSQR